MPYLAHVGICLRNDYTVHDTKEWIHIKEHNGLNYYWRFNDKNVYEVVCVLFDDKVEALKAAKNMYIRAIYNLILQGEQIADAGCRSYEKRISISENDYDIEHPDSSFFWNPKCIGGGLGPDVYEVPESIDDFDKIYGHRNRIVKVCFQITDQVLNFENYDTSPFSYSIEVQPLLNTITQAYSVTEIGLKMTLYCGLLEHLSENDIKDTAVLFEIDLLIQHVEESSLVKSEKESLISYLSRGKEVSARQKCLRLCAKYAKEKYGNITVKKIIDDAYSIRSKYSHGEDCHNRYSGSAAYMDYVVLDVLEGYINDKEAPHA